METTNGDVWIIEAKGGIKPDGSSNNIDIYAENKFNALKEYAKKYPNVKWGSIRVIETQLYLDNTVWCKDVMNRNIWKPIEVFI